MPESLDLMRRAWALMVVLVLIVSACRDGDSEMSTTTTTMATTTTSTEPEPTDPALVGPVFRVGLTNPITTINWWAAMDTEGTPENRAVLTNTKTSMFTLTKPGFVQVPALASGQASVSQQGSTWVVEQALRDGVFWSDGTQVTANDLAFYFDVVREFDLGGAHAASFPPSVSDVSAIDELTVRVEFSSEPSISDWQSGVATVPFVPAHFWEPYVEEARDAVLSSRDHLYSIDATDEPSTAPLIVDSFDDGVVVTRSNPDQFARGTEITTYSDGSVRVAIPGVGDDVYGGDASGAVESHTVVGPFVSAIRWQSYDDEDAAYDALTAGDVDYVLDPEGMILSRYNELASDDDIGLSISPADGFRFLAFNLRQPPMSDPVFREVVATVIDKELIASTLFNGTMFPAYTVVPPDFATFHNDEVSRPGWLAGEPMSQGERFETAIEVLTEAGYTWDEEPQIVYDSAGAFVDVTPGSGLEMPNGVDVPELRVVAAPVSGDDPMRATFALWIENWLSDLGIDVTTETTDLGAVADAVLEPDSTEATLSWDMHVLGWSGPDAGVPGLTLAALFHSQNAVESGGLNTTGYSSAEFDAAADALVAARTLEEAAEHTREMERIISEDLPYVVLFRPAVIEAFDSSVEFPVDGIFGGHGGLAAAWPGSVRMATGP